MKSKSLFQPPTAKELNALTSLIMPGNSPQQFLTSEISETSNKNENDFITRKKLSRNLEGSWIDHYGTNQAQPAHFFLPSLRIFDIEDVHFFEELSEPASSMSRIHHFDPDEVEMMPLKWSNVEKPHSLHASPKGQQQLSRINVCSIMTLNQRNNSAA